MVLGGDPPYLPDGQPELPFGGMSEYEFLGGPTGEPVEVIGGPVTGLHFRARLEAR